MKGYKFIFTTSGYKFIFHYPLGQDCPKLPLLKKAHVQHDGAMYRQGQGIEASQGIENGSWIGIASAAQKVVGSIPREHAYWKKNYTLNAV